MMQPSQKKIPSARITFLFVLLLVLFILLLHWHKVEWFFGMLFGRH